MVNKRDRVFDTEKRNVVRVPIDKSPAERKEEYVEERKEAKRLHKLAKEELRHTRNLRKHLQPFEDGYLADAGTLVEFEVVGERPSSGEGAASGARVCPTCGKEETEKTYDEETKDWLRKSTDSLEDIEKHIDNIRIRAEEPTLLKKYEDKFGEKLLIKERSRGYDWSKEIETMAAEKPSWFAGEEKKETSMETETTKEKTGEKMTLANVANIRKIFEPSVKHPWYSLRCLLISERTQPKKRVLKGTVMVVDVILWVPLLLVRVPIFAVLRLKNVVKRKK